MGLDMYLSASKYLAGWDFYKEEARKQYAAVLEVVDMTDVVDQGSPSLTVDVNVGYWRKANAIHKWFVDNCQEGIDDCRRAYVERDQLVELRDLCKEILASVEWDEFDPNATNRWERPLRTINRTLVEEKLPPQGGFFFGDTSVDAGYVSDLEDTIEILDRVLNHPKLGGGGGLDPALVFTGEGVDFYYHSSW